MSEPYKVPSKPKLKKFSLKEALVENGWEAPRGVSTYDTRQFGFWEFLHIIFGFAALALLGYYKGPFNFNIQDLYYKVPFWPLVICSIVLLEVMFYFIFIHGRTKKLDILRETTPMKFISLIIGALVAAITPVVLALSIPCVIAVVNHFWGNYHTRRQFDNMAKHYSPKNFEEPNVSQYEELEEVPIVDMSSTKPPKAYINSSFSEPKLVAIPESEFKRAYDEPMEMDLPTKGDLDKFLRSFF